MHLCAYLPQRMCVLGYYLSKYCVCLLSIGLYLSNWISYWFMWVIRLQYVVFSSFYVSILLHLHFCFLSHLLPTFFSHMCFDMCVLRHYLSKYCVCLLSIGLYLSNWISYWFMWVIRLQYVVFSSFYVSILLHLHFCFLSLLLPTFFSHLCFDI